MTDFAVLQPRLDGSVDSVILTVTASVSATRPAEENDNGLIEAQDVRVV